MDRIVQQNAANAEESASASEEMSSLADHLKDVVREMVTLVGGSKNGTTEHQANIGRPAPSLKRPSFGNSSSTIENKSLAVQQKEAGHKDIVALDDDDLMDF